MMTAAHIARLREEVQSYVNQEARKGKPVSFSAIRQQIVSQGWNLADEEMFADWVSKNITGRIDYKS